ncbi:hypothetical protein GCM10027342_20860 [Photobacterium alginatilyticum]|uniref:Carbon storage regulator n=2 Tax=Photobacterium alginatilyticum TaxID=1775171 RepID=A0ABW9YJT5_9GAMM|nr:hypothetical protein [Photobacterium alginatilyticum]
MNKLTRIFVASTIGGVAIMANASISFPSIDELGLTSLSDSDMSSIRGGFVSINDNIINIGLTMSTAINGEEVLTTRIADFTINNGKLVDPSGGESLDFQDPLYVIDIGDNNINTANTSPNSTGFIIQNSNDGTRINTQMIMDIEADVNGFIQQSIYRNRLENSILHNGY